MALDAQTQDIRRTGRRILAGFPLNNAVLLWLGLLPVAYVFAWLSARYSFPENLVLVLAVPVVVLSLIRFQWAVYVWILTAPLGAAVIVDLPGVPPVHPVQILLAVLLVCWVAKALSLRGVGRVHSPVKVPLALMLTWGPISMIGAFLVGTTNAPASIIQINGWLAMFFPFAAYYLSVNQSNDRRTITSIACMVVASSIPIAGLQFYEYVTAAAWTIGPEHRIGSLFSGNYLGTFYVIVLSILLAWLVFVRRHRLLVSGAILLIICGQLIAFSRASLVATVVSATVILCLKHRSLLLVAIASLAVFLFLNPTIVPQTMAYGQSGSIVWGSGDRLAIIKDDLRIIAEHPIFGIGLDTYTNYKRVFYINPYHQSPDPMPSAHNDYLQIGVALGPLAVVLYLCFLLLVGREALGLYRLAPDGIYRSVAVAFLGMLAAYLVEGMASELLLSSISWRWQDAFYTLSPTLGFWVTAGLVVGSKQLLLEEGTLLGGAGDGGGAQSIAELKHVLETREAAARH